MLNFNVDKTTIEPTVNRDVGSNVIITADKESRMFADPYARYNLHHKVMLYPVLDSRNGDIEI